MFDGIESMGKGGRGLCNGKGIPRAGIKGLPLGTTVPHPALSILAFCRGTKTIPNTFPRKQLPLLQSLLFQNYALSFLGEGT